jgi:hypothetical protein
MRLLALAAALALALPGESRAAPVTTEYLYNLSTVTGDVRTSGAVLAVDAANKEVFALADGLVRVFNEAGMEIYSFASPPGLSGVHALAPLENGDLLFLSYEREQSDRLGLYRANFRGELLGQVDLKGFPPELEGFRLDALAEAGGRIYLADRSRMLIAVTDAEGNFVQVHDVAAMLGDDIAKKRADYGLKGFRVNRKGDVLFTIQPLFKAYVLSAEGTLRAFGQRGSAPGKFNVVAGIAQDERGYLYVTDMLKSAVLVFDPEFRFSKEFGYRGRHRGAILAPVDVVVLDGKVFVSQMGRRGIAVFKVQPPAE